MVKNLKTFYLGWLEREGKKRNRRRLINERLCCIHRIYTFLLPLSFNIREERRTSVVVYIYFKFVDRILGEISDLKVSTRDRTIGVEPQFAVSQFLVRSTRPTRELVASGNLVSFESKGNHGRCYYFPV